MSSSVREMVSIEGLSKAAVLAKLYNASSPAGMGFMMASNGPVLMTVEQAQALLDAGSDASGDYPEGMAALRGNDVYFDYLYGRPLKLDLSSDEEFDPWGFDRDNGGPGTAARLIDELRSSDETNTESTQDAHEVNLNEKVESAMRMAMQMGEPALGMAVLAQIARETLPLPQPPSLPSGKQYLGWCTEEALKYFDSSPTNAIMVFLELVSNDARTRWIMQTDFTVPLLLMGMEGREQMRKMMLGFTVR
ncbi:hypothetical protein KC949_01185 [Candidatus Saccharibacteria bacterium]|nr:hypothetical protein [Candidatus Saccharibacteria bacterium]